MTEIQSIDLDCPPGMPRPGDLIWGVIEDLDLDKVAVEPVDDVVPFFGNACYRFRMDRKEWEDRVQPIIKARITDLYHAGVIRYGSW
jgi:hypothetical protein